MSASLDLAPGSILAGRWRLVERVSEGAFAEVWRAETEEGPPAAIKVAVGELGARMIRGEAATLQRLRHVPGVSELLYADETGDRPWMALGWIEGRTLRAVLRSVHTEDGRAATRALFLSVVDTVVAVHAHRLVHGDLKPENVLVSEVAGATRRAFLTDFGLAREAQRRRLDSRLSQSMKTDEGLAGGTLAYLPPEAVKGGDPTPQGDVYALGVMLHELVLGRRPDKALSPESLKALLDERVVSVLCQALAFDPADRFPDARGFRVALAPLQDALTETGLARRRRALRRFLVSGLAAFFVALRYVSVAGLLALYAGILAGAIFGHPSIALGFLPFVLLHVVVRWEGPESPEEAKLRGLRQVVRPRR